MTYNEYGEKVSDGCTSSTHYFHRGVCCPITKYYDWTDASPACKDISSITFNKSDECKELDYSNNCIVCNNGFFALEGICCAGYVT